MNIGDKVIFKDATSEVVHTIQDIFNLYAHSVGYSQERVYKLDDGSGKVYKEAYLVPLAKFAVGDFIAVKDDASRNPIKPSHIWEIIGIEGCIYAVRNVRTGVNTSWSKKSADYVAAKVEKICTWAKV